MKKRFIAILVLASTISIIKCSAFEVSVEQVQTILDKPAPAHPRLFLNDTQLAIIQKDIDKSKQKKLLNQAIITNADKLLTLKPLERKKIGRRLLSVSREAVTRLFNLSWAYRTTKNDKYLKRAEQEMLAIAKFKDWNPSHFLDVAEMTFAMAVGYDWLYNDLSEESRKVIRQAIVEMGLNQSLNDKRHNWWINSTINWNQVCHAGITCGVLAVMEDESELAKKVIHRSVNKVQLAMSEYEPHGAYPEGPGYWVYGTTYNVILIEALNSALSTDFGLSKIEGFIKSAEYYLHATGPTGLFFNYADCSSNGGYIPTVSWFAMKYNNPTLNWTQNKLFDQIANKKNSDLTRNRTAVLALIWSGHNAQRPVTLSWMGQGQNPVAMFRSSWDDDAAYLAIKGGSPSVSHAHMDVGSFVIDAQGVRWAMDLGKESYNRIESMGISLWDKSQNADRWKLFRYANFGHNTLTVNNKLQHATGFAPIIQYSDKGKFPHAAVDLTDVYKGQLNKAIRGASLLPSGQILIQDELVASKKSAKIRWNMVTPAKVEIKSDTNAIFTQNGKAMQFEVISDSKLKLLIDSTKPRTKYDDTNPGSRIIAFDVNLKPNEKTIIKVVMTPGKDIIPLGYSISCIENWSRPLIDKEIKNHK